MQTSEHQTLETEFENGHPPLNERIVVQIGHQAYHYDIHGKGRQGYMLL